MNLTFLCADGLPLVKQYALEPTGELRKTNYPHARDFTSFSDQADDLDDFAVLLLAHGQRGHCLLKGNTTRALTCESRAGSTDSDAPTDWVCLDLDGAQFASPDDFLAAVGLSDVSYVLQWSASSGLSTEPGLRCHLFLQLSRPTSPALLKMWLTHLNLTVPELRASVALTKTASALRWPLDITTCQNDKLLYIAPPSLGPGLTDPHPGSRIQTFHKARATFQPPSGLPTPAALRSSADVLINDLRRAAGMPKRKASVFKIEHGTEYLSKPDNSVVTSSKQERGFTYLNLNGGDSFAYWHPDDNYEFIHNFKGEPVYKTEELLPAYYDDLKRRNYALTAAARATDKKIYLAFRDFDSGLYWNGFYEQDTDRLTLAPAKNEAQLLTFLEIHNLPRPSVIPIWQRVFDPHTPLVIDREAKPYPTVNLFQPSEYMQRTPVPTYTVPPLCDRLFRHVIGDEDELQDHWHNWCACLFQRLDRNFTGWVWHGTQGTGKGLIVNKIFSPLLGHHNMAMKRMEELASDFTGFFENMFLVVVDEIQTSALVQQAKVTSKLKNLMVEPTISVRRMYRDSYMARNYCNMIFTSNMPDPIVVAPDDRRFNVGNYQRDPLVITEEEVDSIAGELTQLYDYWMTYPADHARAKTPLRTQARDDLINTSMASSDIVVRALQQGDLSFFVDQLPDEPVSAGGNTITLLDKKHALTQEYYTLVKELVLNAPDKLTRDQLMVIFRYCVGNVPDTPNKFTSYLRHHQLHTTRIWHAAANKAVYGLKVTWNVDPAWRAQVLPQFV